jgi:hypothetical protein
VTDPASVNLIELPTTAEGKEKFSLWQKEREEGERTVDNDTLETTDVDLSDEIWRKLRLEEQSNVLSNDALLLLDPGGLLRTRRATLHDLDDKTADCAIGDARGRHRLKGVVVAEFGVF